MLHTVGWQASVEVLPVLWTTPNAKVLPTELYLVQYMSGCKRSIDRPAHRVFLNKQYATSLKKLAVKNVRLGFTEKLRIYR